MIDVPDVRQSGEYDCGLAAADAVLRFHGVRTTVGALALANPMQGTGPDAIEALFRSAGLDVLAGEMTTGDLKHFTATGRPVVCCVNLYGGHWVVVRGVHRGVVYYHCPSDGPRTRKVGLWESVWWDRTKAGVEYRRWGIVAHAR